MADDGEENMPRDGKIVKELLRSMNVEDYEPQVVNQFLELWYRYIADVLTDAHTYSEHAEKSAIDSDDIKLAIQSKVNFSFSQPPPRELVPEEISQCILLYTYFAHFFGEKWMKTTLTCPACESLDEAREFPSIFCMENGPKFRKIELVYNGKQSENIFLEVLLELARSRNKVPLPKSISGPGLRLPPEQDTLISPNYQLAIPKRQISQQAEETEEDEEASIPPNPDQNTSQNQGESSQGTPQHVSFPLIAKNPR